MSEVENKWKCSKCGKLTLNVTRVKEGEDFVSVCEDCLKKR